MAVAIYAGTFDPITNGHVDIIERASGLFDRLIVGVACSSRKQPFFSLEDRLAMVREVVSTMGDVEVVEVDGLLVDFSQRCGASVIVRGVRAVSDFDYEFQMAGMNSELNSTIQTVMLPSMHKYAYISSTMVREIVALGGDASSFVNPVVQAYLKRL